MRKLIKIFFALFLTIVLIGLVAAIDFSPQGNIDLKNRYYIVNWSISNCTSGAYVLGMNSNGSLYCGTPISTGNYTAEEIYIYLDSTVFKFNETLLNETINALSNATTYTAGEAYIYLDGTVFKLNETVLNTTIVALENDTTYSAEGIYVYLDGTIFRLNESLLNDTIVNLENDTWYYAGTGLTIAGTTFGINLTYTDNRYIPAGTSNAWQISQANITDMPTHLSNFTDDLGDRGYSYLSNFTDDLGDRGYTHLSNFTDDVVVGNYLGIDDQRYNNTYSNDTGISLSGLIFSLNLVYRLPQGCAAGQIAEVNSSGVWNCGTDDVGAGGSQWALAGTGWLWNNSGSIDWNSTKGDEFYFNKTAYPNMDTDSADDLTTSSGFGGEVSGNYSNIVLDNNALDDQYYDSESDLTGLLDDNYLGIDDQRYNETGSIISINNSKSGIGDCPSGQLVMNLTTGSPECIAVSGGTDTYWPLTGEVENESGSLGVNDSWFNASIESYNYVPIGTNNAWQISQANVTDEDWIEDSQEPGMNVNSSIYWGNLYTASDLDYAIVIYRANITDRFTHLSNFTDDLGDRGYTHLSNFTDDLDYISGSGDTATGDYVFGGFLIINDTDDNVGLGDLSPSGKLEVQQDSAATGIFIDQNGEGVGLDIDSESITQSGIKIAMSNASKTAISITTGKMDLNGNAMEGVDQVIGNSDNVIIGDAGNDSHTLTADDDLFISGKLEVDGIAYFDNFLYGNYPIILADEQDLSIGNGSDARIRWNTIPTNDNLQMSIEGNVFVFSPPYPAIADDYNHAAQSDPTFFIHSRNRSSNTTSEWISFFHDTVSGRIDTGTGLVNVSGNNITGVKNIIGEGDNIVIGDAGADGHTLVADDDLFVSGKLEVDGSSYFDGSLRADNSIYVNAGVYLWDLTHYYLIFYTEADDGTHFIPGGDDGYDNNHIIITNWDNRVRDHDRETLATDPELYIFGAENVDTDNTEYLRITYKNSTDEAELDVGSGIIVLKDDVRIEGDTNHTGQNKSHYGTGCIYHNGSALILESTCS